jgi:hypothetical protein
MNPPLSPLRYSAALDQPEKDEAETAEAISQVLLKISDKTFADGRHAIRSVHAKGHGLLQAEVEVLADLPPALAQGIFASPKLYPAVMRFSTIPGDILPDSISTPRGLAIKMVGVDGERLEDSTGTTQDFLMVNGPQFNAPSGKAFLASMKLLAPTTDRLQGTKKALSAVLRNVEKLVETFGGESALAKTLGGEPPSHILGETFYSQLALRFGDYIAKLQIAPVSPDLIALTHQPIDLDNPDILRTLVAGHFRTHTSVWELRAQLCTNLEDMPIDDPTKVWDRAASPFVTVARITAGPQVTWSETRASAVDDGMGFSPWHGIQAHRPLGAIMRMRKLAYARSQQFRSERNATPVREPDTLERLPD